MNRTRKIPVTLVDEYGQVNENFLNGGVLPEHLDILIKKFGREGAEVKLTDDGRLLIYEKRSKD